MKNIMHIALIATLCLAAVAARANTITLAVDPNVTDPGSVPFVLGDVNPPEPADPADVVQEINVLRTLALGGSQLSNFGAVGETEYRSHNAFGSLPLATLNGSVGGSSTTFTDTGFAYLAAKYDGPNGGLEIWDIAGIAAGTTITIPQNAFGAGNNQYGLSGWTLFNSTSVPDAGSTAALLGFALVGGELLRRRMQRS
jgi:hypothetical protein